MAGTYEIVEHIYDVLIASAGGAGLRVTRGSSQGERA